MLAMRKKITDKIIAIILLISLTVTDFLFVGKSAISYALDVIKTNNANVEFTAYFLDNNGMKVEKIQRDINDEETRLIVEVAVKNEGYFNGKISLKNNNFNIEQVSSNEYVEQVYQNEVTLKQINAGNTALVELKVTSIKDELIDYSKLFGETLVELNGEYINGNTAQKDKYIPIKGETKLEIDWVSNENTRIDLDARLLTNYIYKENNENKRIVQIIINSKVKDNSYPIKNTQIELNVPKNVKEVKVHTRDNSATNINQNFSENNYVFDKENSKLNIKLTNEDINNISWRKNSEDIIIVTYVFDVNDQIENPNIVISDNIQTYDEKLLTMTQNLAIDTEIDGITSIETNLKENAIYKGKLYTGEERYYNTLTKLNIDYANVEENISVKENESFYLIDKNPLTSNILYKQIKINRQEFTQIFGENGYIIVKDENGTVLANVNKEAEVDENGYIIVSFMQGAKSLEIITSKPEKVGILKIENAKQILNTEYDRSIIDSLTAVKEISEFKHSQVEKEITLLNTTTEASLEIENTVISENNKELTLTATLLSNNESKELYKNPKLTITLPEGVKATEAKYAVLDKNGLEVESCIVNNSDMSRIEMQIVGEQLTYDISGGTKIYIKISNMEINPAMPSKKANIEFKYTNEKTNIENTLNKEIKIESQYGLILYNEMSGYKENEVLIENNNGTSYGNLDINAESKQVNLQTVLVNNFGQEIKNVTLVGKIPHNDDDNSTFEAILNSCQTNKEAKVMYSPNVKARADDDSWVESPENAKAYKIQLDQMLSEDVFIINTWTTIPENLDYNQSAVYQTNVTYSFNDVKEESNSHIILATEKLNERDIQETIEKENINGLEVTTLATVANEVLGEEKEVYEGQKIKYYVTIKNNSGRDYDNLNVKTVQKNGNVWGLEKKIENIHSDYRTWEEMQTSYYRQLATNELEPIVVESLKNGESYTYSYEVSTYLLNNENRDGEETFGTIYITSSENNINEEITTIRNQIKKAELQVDIYNGMNEEYKWDEGSIPEVTVELKNLYNEELNNVKVQLTISKELTGYIDKENFKNFELESCINCNEDNISLENIETNDLGEINLTLNIAKLEANAKEGLYLSLATERIEPEKVTSYVIAKATTQNNNTYISKYEKEINRTHIDVYAKLDGNVNGNKINEDTILENGDTLELVATVSNNDNNKNLDITTNLELDSSLEIQNAKLITNSKEENINVDENTLDEQTVHLNPNETAKIEVFAKVNARYINNVSSSFEAYDTEGFLNYTEQIDLEVNSQGEDIDEFEDSEEEIDEDIDEELEEELGEDLSDEEEIETNNSKKYRVSGITWIDTDKDGRRNSSEERINGVTVSALNMATGEIIDTTSTDEDGNYSLKLEEGNYSIVFEYDTDEYNVTSYQASSVNERKNSDVIAKTINVDGEEKNVGLTNTFELNSNVTNIDMGLVKINNFDLRLQKYVSKIIVTNEEGTKTYEQKDLTKLAKAEIKAKYLSGSLVIIEYKMIITNVGDIEGYAKNIEDTLPNGLAFNSNINHTWYKKDDKLYNTSLANTTIAPGDSKEIILTLTKNMTETNTGLISNTAKIIESSNSQGIEDKTEDKAQADVIISVSTGALINYIVIVLNIVILLGLACYVMIRFLKKEDI